VNEHTGAIVTNGVIDAHDNVMPPGGGGVTYPKTGFTVIVPSAPVPAGTLLGATALFTLMVNCGVTARTARGSNGVV
jgi:hypothetical protein